MFSLKSLLCVLFSVKHSLIIVEGISALLFAEEEKVHSRELCIELESTLKELSRESQVVVTSNISGSGDVLGMYLWHQALPYQVFVQKVSSNLEVTLIAENVMFTQTRILEVLIDG